MKTALSVTLLLAANPALAITALSQSDPSLAGTTLENTTVQLTAYGGQPPIVTPPPFATADERVVRNTTGTLDFYYRFAALPGQTTTADWIEFLPLPASVSFTAAYLSDGRGDLTPTQSAIAPLLFPDGQYVAFGFQSSSADIALTPAGTKWLLLRTNATDYGSYVEAFFPPEPFGAMGEGANTPRLFSPFDVPSVPEPTSLFSLPLAIAALAARVRRQ